MRKFCLPLALLLLLYAGNSKAQSMQGPPVSPRDLSAYQNFVNINGQDGFYLKKDLYLTSSMTIVKGEKVLGIPFLFMDWLKGTLSTPDGRVYTDYKFRYNVYDQTVFFHDGRDSLEANEEIKEFTLQIVQGDSIITSRFINSNQFQKGKTFYYEVLLDNEKGQLLKTNQKVVAMIDEGLHTSSAKKYFKLEYSYAYFDKATKKLTRIRPSTDIGSMLRLPEDQAKALLIGTYDFTKEEDLLTFLKLYAEKSKGF